MSSGIPSAELATEEPLTIEFAPITTLTATSAPSSPSASRRPR